MGSDFSPTARSNIPVPPLARSISYGGDEKKEKGPRRRKHKNSKNGCPNCKKRRVKCSEDFPSCLNCIKHKVRCGYLDYTEEQIGELKRLKDTDDEDPKPIKPSSFSVSSESTGQSKNSISKQSPVSPNSRHSLSATSTPDEFQQSEKAESQPQKNFGVNDVLNFHSSITQDFHNILPTNSEGQIIYPVYSINQTSPNSEPQPDQSNPQSDIFHQSRDVFSTLSPSYQIDMMEGEYYDKPPINFQFEEPFLDNIESPPDVTGPDRSLPGVIKSQTSFKKQDTVDLNYGVELLKYLAPLAPKIALGTANLFEIRNLYTLWLNSFIYKSFTASIMFSCLINLTTNYLISNVLNIPHESFGDLVSKTRSKNILIVHSVKHYAIVIKGLRNLLNNNDDPELCAQVSYSLSLMSIYDPEATLHSTNCFRDGLLGILSYTLNLARKNGVRPPTLIPIHLNLMTNICRSIYLPGYDPTFMNEFLSVLENYNGIIKRVQLQAENEDSSDLRTLKFVSNMCDTLMSFANDTVNKYIPQIINNLSNIDIQQDTLFTMAHRWVRLQPSKLTLIYTHSDPLEKILYLFYKCFKKAMFAVAPQVKYFFLRDFDSPLMLDVFSFYNDFKIFDVELENPTTLCIPTHIYQSVKIQLKMLSAYLIRMLTFFEARLKLLYKTIVYGVTTKELFPIHNIKDWRNSIQDIQQVRADFNDKIGLVEQPIKSFSDTLIREEHFPKVVKKTEILQGDNIEPVAVTPSETGTDYVDLLTLTDRGLLQKDAKPSF